MWSNDEGVGKPDTRDVEMRYCESARLRNVDGRLGLSSHANDKRPFDEEMILIEVTPVTLIVQILPGFPT